MGEDWMLQPAGIPWSNWLAIELISAGDGLSSMRIAWRQDLADDDEVLASGVLTSLIDQACGVAVMSRLGILTRAKSVGMSVPTVSPGSTRPSFSVTRRSVAAKTT